MKNDIVNDNVIIDGVEYPVKELPDDIITKLKINDSWKKELEETKILVFKLEHAISSLESELITSIRNHQF